MNTKIQKLLERIEAAVSTLPTRRGEGPIFIYNPNKYDPNDPESLNELYKQIPDDAEVIVLIPDNGRGDCDFDVIGGEESGQ